MRALPMTYHGTEFRSRLEAHWAFNLDALGIVWHYEPQGYELSDGTWYSPDFYLPQITTWLEVKGAHDERLDKVAQFALDSDELVLIGRDPLTTSLPQWPNQLLAHAPGWSADAPAVDERDSGRAVVLQCPACGHASFVLGWFDACRACRECVTATTATGATYRRGLQHARPFAFLTAPGGRR